MYVCPLPMLKKYLKHNSEKYRIQRDYSKYNTQDNKGFFSFTVLHQLYYIIINNTIFLLYYYFYTVIRNGIINTETVRIFLDEFYKWFKKMELFYRKKKYLQHATTAND